jgi:hypothetical protein
MLIVVLTCGRAWPDNGLVYHLDQDVQHPHAAELWENWSDPGIRFWSKPPGPLVLTIDYRFRTLCSSATSFEFGTIEPPPVGWAPLSRLDFPINSCWHGFRFGLEKSDSAIHFEWMAPQTTIQGNLEDFDWAPPNPDGSITDLGFAQERWNDGQMLDFGYEFRILERPLGLPVEVWPTVGFRWQRLNLTAYNLTQVKSDNVWLDPPFTYEGDVITFNQEYSIGYVGAQLRGRLESRILPPIALTLQGDWGYTEAYNTDHHLIREGDMYVMHRTHGSCWHVALTAEALFCRERLSMGFQVDHLRIDTQGTHRWINEPYGIDETWDNGVSVWSRQTWLTAFIRTRF